MKRTENFDERQILNRGFAYRNGFFTALFAVLGLYALKELFGAGFVNSDVQCYIPIWLSATAFSITAIRKDAFEELNDRNSMAVVMVTWIIVGAFFSAMGIYRLVRDFSQADIVLNELYADFVSHIVPAFCMLAVGIVWAVKRRQNKKNEESED